MSPLPFMDYIRPLVTGLPEFVSLEDKFYMEEKQ